jgi:small subunit ribosomal protein S1
MPETSSLNPTRDEFAALLDESFSADTAAEGSVVKGRIVAVQNDYAIIDVGLKTEGRVPLREFQSPGGDGRAWGRRRGRGLSRAHRECLGEAVLSREKARREEAWTGSKLPMSAASGPRA